MEHVVIVGLGLIGDSLAKAFAAHTEDYVAGIDTDPAVIEAALAEGAIAKEGTAEDLAHADFVYLCLYPQADLDFLKAHAPEIRKGAVVTDVCGIKGEICGKLAACAEQNGFFYCGSHPMAGTEKHGYFASYADLFKGASYLLAPCGAPEEVVDRLRAKAFSLGFGRCVLTTPEEHDRMIAFTSQVPHALACAYVLSPCCPKHRGFSAGSYRDVSRVANINETLWTELFLDNAGPLTAELDTLLENLSAIRNAIASGDRGGLCELLRRGRLIKEELGE